MTTQQTPPTPAGVSPVHRGVGRPGNEGTDDGGLTALVMACAFSIRAGQPTVTISAVGKRPAGFPRGELLSVGTGGQHNYAVCPVKMLAWLHARRRKTPNVGAERPPEAVRSSD